MSSQDRGVSSFTIIVAVAAVMAGAIAIFLFLHQRGGVASSVERRTSLTEEQKAYLTSVEFTEARMSAAENFLGSTVTYLKARVTNKGQKVVRGLDVELTFADTLNQIVLRETAHPISSRTPPLQPGESRSFQATFDHMPVDWNQAPPTIRPISVRF